jgi:hypothetical protein
MSVAKIRLRKVVCLHKIQRLYKETLKETLKKDSLSLDSNLKLMKIRQKGGNESRSQSVLPPILGVFLQHHFFL